MGQKPDRALAASDDDGSTKTRVQHMAKVATVLNALERRKATSRAISSNRDKGTP
jgi:hypothetical protein